MTNKTKNSEIAAYTAMGGAGVGAAYTLGQAAYLNNKIKDAQAVQANWKSATPTQTVTANMTPNMAWGTSLIGTPNTHVSIVLIGAGISQNPTDGAKGVAAIQLLRFDNGGNGAWSVTDAKSGVLSLGESIQIQISANQIAKVTLDNVAYRTSTPEVTFTVQQYPSSVAAPASFEYAVDQWNLYGPTDIVIGTLLVASVVVAAIMMKYDSIKNNFTKFKMFLHHGNIDGGHMKGG